MVGGVLSSELIGDESTEDGITVIVVRYERRRRGFFRLVIDTRHGTDVRGPKKINTNYQV